MAVDLKIEVFCVDVLRDLWTRIGVTRYVLPRARNYDDVKNQFTCIDEVVHAIICRRSFFHTFLWSGIYFDYDEFSKSGLDFYIYLQNNFTKYLPYQELNIFDKLLMSFIIVADMSAAFFIRNDCMFSYIAPLCWSMYFDVEYKDEFYNNGGWEGLIKYANSYNVKVLTYSNKYKGCKLSAQCAFNDAMTMDYSSDLTNRIFKKKIQDGQVSCQKCLPLFHVVKKISGLSENYFTEFQLTEGYIQLIRYMLSQDELQRREEYFLRDTEFTTFSEIKGINTSEANDKQGISEIPEDKTSFQKCVEYLKEYQVHNTYDFLARLFASDKKLSTTDNCMFCGRNVNEPSKNVEPVSDYYVKKVNSAIHNTLVDVELKGDESAKASFEADKIPEKDDDVKEALQLFFYLGIRPYNTYIPPIFEKRKNQSNRNDTSAGMDTLKLPESGITENKRKKRHRKNKRDVCDKN